MHDWEHAFVPALRFRALTPLYDMVVSTTLREDRWRAEMLSAVVAWAPASILDVGCGTGTFAIMAQNACPTATVVGIDADGDALAIARRKAGSGSGVDFRLGDAQALAAADASFDCVVSSLFFHHLPTSAKLRVLAEMRRVVRADGCLVIADWGVPATAVGRLGFGVVRALDGFANTADAAHGSLPGLVRKAGFGHVAELAAVSTLFGTIRVWRAQRIVANESPVSL